MSIRESVRNIPTNDVPCTLNRIYAPSGTSAATEVYETLLKLGFVPRGIKPSKKTLTQFTPYFEFYLGAEAFLFEGTAKKRSGTIQKVTGTQIWLNLSDSLHGYILEKKVEPANVGLAIAGLLKDHIQCDTVSLLVIDYTKFGGEMPNGILYPMLAQLARVLTHADMTSYVVFLRSNLKYNTGPLDRYQAGEILVYGNGPENFLGLLTEAAQKYFLTGHPDMPESNRWGLCDEYISLMKKVYLMSDAISSWRWSEYAKLW